jgi:hypothetical protein
MRWMWMVAALTACSGDAVKDTVDDGCVGTNCASAQDCPEGGCDLSCDGRSCEMSCAGDTCDIDCAGGGCNVTCTAADCLVGCAGDGCNVSCSQADSCVIDTCDNACVLTCGGSDVCDNACGVMDGCITN